MIKNKNHKKGMTLVELIVYIGIVGIVLVVMIDLVTNLVYFQTKNAGAGEVQQNVHLISQKLIDSIENANNVSGGLPANQLNLNVNGDLLSYNLSGNVFQVSKNGGAPIPISNTKVVISPPPGGQIFTKITNGSAESIKINLDVSLTSDINSKETLSTTVLLRGK